MARGDCYGKMEVTYNYGRYFICLVDMTTTARLGAGNDRSCWRARRRPEQARLPLS